MAGRPKKSAELPGISEKELAVIGGRASRYNTVNIGLRGIIDSDVRAELFETPFDHPLYNASARMDRMTQKAFREWKQARRRPVLGAPVSAPQPQPA